MGPELEPKHVPLFWFAGGPALDRVDGADRRPSKQTGIRVLHRRVRQPFFGRCRMQMLRYSLLGPLRKKGITIDNSPETRGTGASQIARFFHRHWTPNSIRTAINPQ